MPSTKTKKKRSKKGANDVEEPAEGVEASVEMEGLASRRLSEGRDLQTPEPHDLPPQRKRRKKKAQTPDQEGEPSELVNGNGADHIEEEVREEVTRKSRRKKKSKMAELSYASDLAVEEDDLTDAPPIPQHALFSSVPPGHSQPVGKVFVERNRRFQTAERGGDHLPRHSTALLEDYMEVRTVLTTRDVAMRVHGGFRVVGLFSHGFLAGYAVWNIIVVYVLAGEELDSLPNLLQQYHPLAYPAQALTYLLLAVSTVSAFDRVNLAKASMALRGFFTLDPAALASFLYFAALILSLSQQMTADRINLYPTHNQTLWPPGSEQQVLQPWIVVNLVVALLVGMAWAFISTRPEIDYTEDFLMSMEVEEYSRQDEKLDLQPA